MANNKNKWTAIRAQTAQTILRYWKEDQGRREVLTDVGLTLVSSLELYGLDIVFKDFKEFQEVMESSPELVRDFKIAKAKLEYSRTDRQKDKI